MKNHRLPLALLFFSVPTLAVAQSDIEQPPTNERGGENLVAPAPAGRSANLLQGVAFDLAVSEEESEASVEIGGYSSRLVSLDERPEQTNFNWSLKLAVPIGGQTDLTADTTLDALTNGPSLTLSAGIFGFRSAAHNLFSDSFQVIMHDAGEECVRNASRASSATEAQIQTAIASCRDQASRPDPEFAAQHSTYSDAAINRSLLSGMWRLGFQARVGVNEFQFIDPATLSELEETKFQFSVGLVGALYPDDAMSAIIAGVEYQNAFEAADDAILCRPVVVDPSTDCLSGSPSAPEHVERLNLSVEYRRLFQGAPGGGSFAISPKGMIDALSGEFELELPLYYVPAWDLPIAPGVALTYSSEDNELDFGVFLRTSFSFQ